MNYQPLIDATAYLVGGLGLAIRSWWFIAMFCLTWFCLIFSAERVGKWIEAVGLNGIIDAFGAIWAWFRTGKAPERPQMVYLAPSPVEPAKEAPRTGEMVRYPGPARGSDFVTGPVTISSLDPTQIPRNDTGLVAVGDPAMRSSGEAP